MKKTKLLFLSLFALLIFQHVSNAQITQINTDGFDKVCYGDMIPYSFDGTATSITSVTINPSSAGYVDYSTTGSTTITWNSNLTTATITVNYTYDKYISKTCTKSDGTQYDCSYMESTDGTITSGTIGLKAPTGSISGLTSITCTDPSPVTYTVPDATVTNWSFIPTTMGVGSWTISASNSSSATFDPNIGVSGTVKAVITNPGCNNSTATISLHIDRPPLKPALTAPSSALSQSALKGVSVRYTMAPIPGATSYTFSATPVGTSQPGYYEIAPRSATSPSADIKFQYSGAYKLTVGYTGGDVRCGNGTTKDYLINVICPEPNNVTPCGTSQIVAIPYSATGFSIDQFPRFVQDINSDGRADIIMFTAAGLYVSVTNKNDPNDYSYSGLMLASSAWAVNSNWPSQSVTPRFLADVNNDNFPDVVGFSQNGVIVSLNNGNNGFGSAAVWSLYGCANTGWTNQDATLRLVQDINGDNRADIVGFSSANTFVMYAKTTNNGFQNPVALANCGYFCNANFPSNSVNPRFIKKMNSDNYMDIVIIASDGIFVATQNSNNTFNAPVRWLQEFGTNDQFINQAINPRMLVDMDGNGSTDVIGFGGGLVKVALNNGNGLNASTIWSEGYTPYVSSNANSGYANYDVNPRLVGDINGDGYADLIGFKQGFVAISKNINGTGFSCPDYEYKGPNGTGGAYTGAVGYTSQTYFPRYLADTDGDHRMEIIGFYTNKVETTNCNPYVNNSGSTYFRSGIDETEVTTASNVLSCYPNPASDVITFKIANMSGDAHIVIFDGTGSKVKEITSEDLASGAYTLNTSGLLNGVYYYQYTDGSGNVKADKFIVMK